MTMEITHSLQKVIANLSSTTKSASTKSDQLRTFLSIEDVRNARKKVQLIRGQFGRR